ncbi:MAG: PQQ-dependent sugar dehydrogenase [Actinomycetes bacterium]
MRGSRAVVAALVVAVGATGCTGERPASSTSSSTADLPAEGRVVLVETGARVTSPVDLVTGPGGKVVMVAERAGKVTALTVSGNRLTDPQEVLDLTGRVGSTDGERGLLGIAVAPNGARLYTSYTRAEDGASVVDEYRLAGDAARPTVDPATRRELLVVEQPYANHNGGDIAFGPDGYLYVALGDGGSGGDPEGRAQDLFEPLGKILRIDPRRAVPEDNPFNGRDDADARIWLRGVRNPWRISFDPANGDLWIGDVGQDRFEEVNVLRAADGGGRGANLGWDLREGTADFADADPAAGDPGPLTDPVYTYEHGDGACSVTGGVVYRGNEVPSLQGRYLFGDFCAPGLQSLDAAGPTAARPVPGTEVSGVVGLGTGPTGEVYVLSLDGGISRLTST